MSIVDSLKRWWTGPGGAFEKSNATWEKFGGMPGHVWVAHQRVLMQDDYRQSIMDWLTANGVDPTLVPSEPHASVADGNLTINMHVRGPNKSFVFDPTDPEKLLVEAVTVPVKVKPNKDVELWLWPKCETCGR